MELSNAVKVLIARMETHPDDFETYGKARFSMLANGLMGLAEVDKEHHAAFWFLSDTDRQALVEAWKKLHYTKWEKNIMETVFDDGYEERQREQEAQMQIMKQQMYQQQMAAQQIKAGGISPLYNNPNQGLLSSAGSAFSGIFGGSR